MAQTDITLRAGEASPTDVRLYATGTAAEAAPILVYLCQTATQPSAPEISLTLRAGEASSTDIRLHSSSYTAASQDTDVILRPVGLPCGTVTSSAALTAVESADAFAGTVEVITVAASDLAIAALESSDTFAGTLAGVGSVPAVEPNSGGWPIRSGRIKRRDVRAEIERERIALGIGVGPSHVIESVARAQVARGVSDEIERTQELLGALEAAHIAWRREFDAALSAYIEAIRLYEIAALLDIGGVYADIERREQEYSDRAIALLLLTQ